MTLNLTMIHGICALQLQSIDKNPGVLPVKLGQAYRQEDKWTIVKVIDLSDIQDELSFNSIKYWEFDRLVDINKPYAEEFSKTRLQARNLHNVTIQKFKQIVPFSRLRRGLLNPLGSLIKIVTGNLDHEDAVRYDKLISQAKGNEIRTEKRLTIISKMLDSMIKDTETLHNDTLIIDERLKRVERIVKNTATKENNSIYATYILNMFHLFMSNFYSIYMTISEIETALALSKVSVLHQSIINSDELLAILESVSKTSNLVYPVSVSNLVKIERTFIVKAYVKKYQITFVIEAPLTDGHIYNYFKIYSLPILNPTYNLTSVIIPKYPYLLAKSSKYLPVDKPCEEIAVEQFLCKEDDMVPYPESTCVEQLMRFEDDLTLCKPRTVEVEDIKVQRIGPMNWIVYSRTSHIMTERCHEDVIRRRVLGTYLIITDENCDLYLEDKRLDRRRSSAAETRFKVTPITGLPELKNITSSEELKVNIKGVNLDNLKHLSNILKESDLDSENVIIDTQSVSLATVLLYISIILFFIIFIVLRYKARNHRDSKSSDDFELEEGGVIPPEPLARTVRVNA